MEKLSAVIVDDERNAIEMLENLLEEFPEVELKASVDNADDGIKQIIHHNPEIVFLDIHMPNKNGFEMLDELKEYNINPNVIFTTGYDEYAIQAIRYSAFDYLMKPVDSGELKNAIIRFEQENPTSFFSRTQDLLVKMQYNKLKFNARTGFILVEPQNIVYCKADSNYTLMFINDGRKECLTQNISKIEHILPRDLFIRTSRSLLLNIKYLDKVDRKNRICELGFNGQNERIKIPYRSIRILEQCALEK